MKEKRIAIIGASSFVGSYIYNSLGEYISLATYYSHSFIGGQYFDAKTMDINNLFKKNKITHAIVVFAEPDVDKCKLNLIQSYELNVSSTKKIIDACLLCDIKPLFLSSEYVFNGEKGLYSESDNAVPNTCYGSQKVDVENYLINSKTSSYSILRLAKVYGTNPNDKSIFSSWGTQIINNHIIKCAVDQYFSPVNVSFVAEVVKKVIDYDLSGIYHVAGSSHVSRYELLTMFRNSCNLKFDIQKIQLSEMSFIDNRPLNLTLLTDKIVFDTGLIHNDLQFDIKQFNKSFFN